MLLDRRLRAGCGEVLSRVCQTLAANAEEAVLASGVEAEVVKVREIAAILTYDGIRALPALAIDGEVKVCGRVPGVEEIKRLMC